MGDGSFTASIMRGGTSKGIVLPLDELPAPGPERDGFLIALMGSNDRGQVDGFGGGASTTSKVMMVGDAAGEDRDVDYLFAQVDPRNPVVDYGGNCGNMTAAVALYCVLERLVEPTAPASDFVMLNLNTATRVRARVPTESDGRPSTAGAYRIPGVSRPGPEIVTEYLDPAGPTGLLPTGAAREVVDVAGVGEVPVSIVDVSSPLVFVAAQDVGLAGTELPEEIDGDDKLLATLEQIRGTAAVRLGLAGHPDEAARVSPGIPKMAMVTPPIDYETSSGDRVGADEVDVVARIMSVQRAHPTYALTGTMCTVAACAVPGTIPHEVSAPRLHSPVRLGHPAGVNEADLVVADHDGSVEIRAVRVSRTARRMMRGTVDPFR